MEGSLLYVREISEVEEEENQKGVYYIRCVGATGRLINIRISAHETVRLLHLLHNRLEKKTGGDVPEGTDYRTAPKERHSRIPFARPKPGKLYRRGSTRSG